MIAVLSVHRNCALKSDPSLLVAHRLSVLHKWLPAENRFNGLQLRACVTAILWWSNCRTIRLIGRAYANISTHEKKVGLNDRRERNDDSFALRLFHDESHLIMSPLYVSPSVCLCSSEVQFRPGSISNMCVSRVVLDTTPFHLNRLL